MSEAFDAIRRVTAPWIERPFLTLPLPHSALRRMAEMGGLLARELEDMRIEWREVAGRPVRISHPKAPRGRMLWAHGGGFVMGSPRTYGAFVDRLARRAHVEIWTPDYRLAPEHPFPAGPDDVTAVARAMPGRFHLGGDSAGGTLALVALQTLLAHGATPASLTLVSPGVDLRPTRKMHRHREMLFTEDILRRFQDAYVGGADPTDPRISPLFGDYTGAPPTHLDIAEGEFLEAESLALAARMRAAGVAVTLHAEPGVPHDYQILAGWSAAADRALGRIAAHMHGATG